MVANALNKLFVFTFFCLFLGVFINITSSINFHPDDQPPWYHSSWPELHPSEMDTHQLITYLMENVIKYRSRIPAAVQDGDERQKVFIDLYIAGVPSVDEVDQTVKVTMNLRAIWNDRRLVFSRYNSSLEYLNIHYTDVVFQDKILPIVPPRMWKPDMYVINERGALRLQNTEPNIMYRIYQSGRVIVSQKLVIKVQCDMKFHRFPLDNQNCPLYISTSNIPDSEAVFEWNEANGQSAVTLADELTLPEFVITGAYYKNVCRFANPIPDMVNFTCLEAVIHMERLFAYYFIEVYVPSMMVVALSWMNFWIDIEAIPARISLGLLTVLTTSTQRSGIVNRTPKVSYTKAVDIWMTFCLFMVVAAMMEYSLVNMIAHKAKMGDQLLSSFANVDDSQSEDEDEPASTILRKEVVVRGRRRSSIAPEQLRQMGAIAQLRYRIRRTIKRLKTNRAYAVDVLSRIMFPTIFGIFNLIYWFTYLVVYTEEESEY